MPCAITIYLKSFGSSRASMVVFLPYSFHFMYKTVKLNARLCISIFMIIVKQKQDAGVLLSKLNHEKHYI